MVPKPAQGDTIVRYLALLTATFLAAPLWGHHSDAGLDMDSILAFEGTVTEFAFRNPHVYVGVETDASGERVEWALQMGTANGLTRRGWTRDSVRPGTEVLVRGCMVLPTLSARKENSVSCQ